MTEVSGRSILAGVLSVFLSASLIFLLEPMVGRLLLPTYGGSAAVWNTALMVFQLLLLAGYLYAHLVATRLTRRGGAALHLALVVGSVLLLPPVIAARDAAEGWPVASIVMAMVTGIGLLFVLLSANTVITQRWLADAGMRNPFWLYAASNTGSLAALLAYPLVVEPFAGVQRQLRGWAALYIVFIAVTALVFLLTSRQGAALRPPPAEGRLMAGVSRRTATVWVLLSAVPSSLLMSTTLQVTNEAGAAPLFWVVPLAIYLATFVIAFSTRRVPAPVLYWGTVVSLVPAFVSMINPVGLSLPILAFSSITVLFFGALFCHTVLAEQAPAPEHLTSFYLWVAVGGLAGGVFNALMAPVMFRSVAEYPLTLMVVAVLLARYGVSGRGDEAASTNLFGKFAPVIAPAIAVVIAAVMVLLTRRGTLPFAHLHDLYRWEMMPIGVMLFAVPFARNRNALLSAALFSSMFVMLELSVLQPPVEQLRSFYGVAKVVETSVDRRLIHGATLHGTQNADPAKRRIASTYYHEAGPIGFAVRQMPPNSTVGVIGLGAGSLAALGQAGQLMYFYEIDPVVVEIALRYFTYVADSPARVFFVLGDGRKRLEEVTDVKFDLLIVDAFSGDAVPTHLLTREAIDLYMSRLKPDGVVVFHISSRYANLARVLRGWAKETGAPVAVSRYDPQRAEELEGATRVLAAAVAPSPRRLVQFATSSNGLWRQLSLQGPSVYWTDDHVDLPGVLWRRDR
jgi:SAM-dependent methyltransferase